MMPFNSTVNVAPTAVLPNTINRPEGMVHSLPFVPSTVIPTACDLQYLLNGISSLSVSKTGAEGSSANASENVTNDCNFITNGNYSGNNYRTNHFKCNMNSTSSAKPLVCTESLLNTLPPSVGVPITFITAPPTLPTQMQIDQALLLNQLDHKYIVPNANENLISTIRHNQADKVNNLGSNIYVASLPETFTDAELLALFAPFGPILSAKVMCHKSSNRCKGYGFVLFEREDDAARAQSAMIGHVVGGNKIQVRRARISASTSLTSPSGHVEHVRNRYVGNDFNNNNSNTNGFIIEGVNDIHNGSNVKNSNFNRVSPLSLPTNTNTINTFTTAPTSSLITLDSSLNASSLPNNSLLQLMNAHSSLTSESQCTSTSQGNHSRNNSATNVTNGPSNNSTETMPQTFIVSSNPQAPSCTYSPFITNNDAIMLSSVTSDGVSAHPLSNQLQYINNNNNNNNTSPANMLHPVTAVPLYWSTQQVENALGNGDSMVNINNVSTNANAPQVVYMMVPLTQNGMSTLSTY